MSYQHKNLAAGRWRELPFIEQMANIGSEVERALNWQKKNHTAYCQMASDRAFELVDLTVSATTSPSRLKELLRMREALVDYFIGDNRFMSTENSWRNYFSAFAYAARKNK